MFARKPFNLFCQEVLVTLSSANYKFPNPRHLGASLKQRLFVLRLAVNCSSVESGRFVSQGSSRRCNCQCYLFEMFPHRALRRSKMGNSSHRLPKGAGWRSDQQETKLSGLRAPGSSITSNCLMRFPAMRGI